MMFETLILSLATTVQAVPPQATQLPPPPLPVPAPVIVPIEVDTRPYVAITTSIGTIVVQSANP